MADYRAIAAVCDAVIRLLQSHHRVEDFDNALEFAVYTTKDFVNPMDSGVSLFLYRIFPNGTHRTPSGRIGHDGRRYQTQLPLDLHFLLTAWGKDASLQYTIAGWMMRILEDTSILPVGLLNEKIPAVFRPDEIVEISITELRTEDMLRIWETLVPNDTYQLSVPYVARNVRIESTRMLVKGEPLQKRTFDYVKS